MIKTNKIICCLAGMLVLLSSFGLSALTTTIPNTTNACINSTYKVISPSTSPTIILIDRRLNINPVTMCTTVMSNYANCGRDNATYMVLTANISSQFGMMNSCSWNCGAGCGSNINTGPSDGLPVELMEFSLE